MYDVVTFGEVMVRLSPPHYQRLEQTNGPLVPTNQVSQPQAVM